MTPRTRIGINRKLVRMFVPATLLLLFVFAALSWFFLQDGGYLASGSRAERPDLSAGPPCFEDGGPPPLPWEKRSQSAMDERPNPHGLGIRRHRLPLVLCAGLFGLALLGIGSYLFWLLVQREMDRAAARSARFTADVAHELKTPLAVMQSVVEHAIRHSDGNAGVERLGSDVLDEVRRLKSLVTRLLLLAQSDAGTLRLNMEKLDLSELVKLSAEDLSMITGDDPVETNIEDGIIVMADRSLITQVVQNLVSNAVKYNRHGFTISLCLVREGDVAVLSVSNGVDPVAPPDVDRIFDRFYRGDTARGSKLEGAGLGLSLAKEVVVASGGQISASIEGDRIVLRAAIPVA